MIMESLRTTRPNDQIPVHGNILIIGLIVYLTNKLYISININQVNYLFTYFIDIDIIDWWY